MSVIINGTDGVQFNDSSLQGAAASPYGLKNRIINGDMRIDQRNAGASGTAGGYTLDRWFYNSSQASKLTWQQNAGSVTPPTGFKNYLGVTSSSSYALLAGDYFNLYQAIEGLNVSDLAWGTANATTITLSFWVRSSLTGTFGCSIQNSAQNRSYPVNYTINSANTWEQKTITIPGETTGTWLTTNGVGIYIHFNLGTGTTYSGSAGSWVAANYVAPTGSTSIVGTNGATWYVTGVQLEVGSTATPFERRLYGNELALCQRYLPAFSLNDQFFGSGVAYNSTAGFIYIPFQVNARTSPTGITTVGSFLLYTTTLISPSSVTFSAAGPTGGLVLANVTGAAAGNGCVLKANTTASIFFTGCEL